MKWTGVTLAALLLAGCANPEQALQERPSATKTIRKRVGALEPQHENTGAPAALQQRGEQRTPAIVSNGGNASAAVGSKPQLNAKAAPAPIVKPPPKAATKLVTAILPPKRPRQLVTATHTPSPPREHVTARRIPQAPRERVTARGDTQRPISRPSAATTGSVPSAVLTATIAYENAMLSQDAPALARAAALLLRKPVTETSIRELNDKLGIVADDELVLAVVRAGQSARAACPDTEAIHRYVEDWHAKRPTKALPAATLADATCARDKIVQVLGSSLGRVAGYKAGLTAKAIQERFNAEAPVSGVLLEKMILPDGAKVPAAFGARGVWEADMLLVVKDEGINQAKTPEEALRHIAAMRPFIELPDLALAPGETLDGTQLAAINVGARLGVAGEEVPLQATPETVKLLADARIVVTDASGTILAENTGAATLGNPLNVVVWLVEDLAKAGRKLSAGDLISVGSFMPLTPPKPGQGISVRYEGFPGTPQVSVTFE